MKEGGRKKRKTTFEIVWVISLHQMPFTPPTLILSIPEQPLPPLSGSVHRNTPQVLPSSPGDMESAHHYPSETLCTSSLLNTPSLKHP